MKGRFDATLRKSFPQKLPKRIELKKRVSIDEGYECDVSLWVPENPISKNPPKIGFTFSHGKDDQRQYIRFILSDGQRVKDFIKEINYFVLENLGIIEKHLNEANTDWQLHRKKRVEVSRKLADSLGELMS